MNLISYFPAKTRKPVHTFDNLFNDFFRNDFPVSFRNGSTSNGPAVNIAETEDGYRIEVAAPGLKKEDFEVKVEQDMLSISAKQEVSEETKEEKYTRKEFSYFGFQRNFHLPETVDANAISASYVDGILHVTLAKKEEAKPQPAKQIEIS